MTIDQELDRATQRGDCLIAHPGATGAGGCRLIYLDGRLVQLHRAIMEQEVQWPLRIDELVLRTCWEPLCINLAHFWIGSRADHTAAMMGAGLLAHGEGHPSHKLTEDEVISIHFMRRAGALYREIGSCYGVSDTLARYIVTGKKWRHVYAAIQGATE